MRKYAVCSERFRKEGSTLALKPSIAPYIIMGALLACIPSVDLLLLKIYLLDQAVRAQILDALLLLSVSLFLFPVLVWFSTGYMISGRYAVVRTLSHRDSLQIDISTHFFFRRGILNRLTGTVELCLMKGEGRLCWHFLSSGRKNISHVRRVLIMLISSA